MNVNDMNFGRNEKNTYRATSNLNTAIENPQINMISAVDVNIKNIDSTNPIDDVYSSILSSNSTFDENQNVEEDNNSVDNFYDSQTDSNKTFDFVNSNLEQNNYVNDVQSQNSSYFISPNLKFDSNSNLNSDSNLGVDNNSNTTFNSNTTSDYVAISGNEQVVYQPTSKDKKNHSVTIKINRELKVMIFIVFILFIFILVIPYIYDFFKELQLVITAG